MEASHSQCPYWIQRNESLAQALNDRCETLEQENKRLQNVCDGLNAQLQGFPDQTCNEDENIEGREQASPY